MTVDHHTLALAASAGALTGMRSMSALSAMSVSLAGSGGNSIGPARLLTSPLVSLGLKLSAAGELAADKLPFIPRRTEPAPLIARVVLAAVAGVTVAQARRSPPIPSGVIAALSAIGSATLASRLRVAAARRAALPDIVAGLIEDAIVVSGSAAFARALNR